MPAGPVHHHQGMGAGGDLGGDFFEVQLHHGGIATRDDKTGPHAPLWTDRAENPDGLGALILGSHRPGSFPRPSAGDLGFLTDPRLIGPPDLYWGLRPHTGPEGLEFLGEVFLKAANA